MGRWCGDGVGSEGGEGVRVGRWVGRGVRVGRWVGSVEVVCNVDGGWVEMVWGLGRWCVMWVGG